MQDDDLLKSSHLLEGSTGCYENKVRAIPKTFRAESWEMDGEQGKEALKSCEL